MAGASIRAVRHKDGTMVYQVRWRTAAGVETSTTFPTMKAARAKQAEVRAGLALDDRMLMRDLLQRWLAARELTVEPATARAYQAIIEHDLIPSFGSRKLSAMTAVVIQEWVNERAGQFSSNTVLSRLRVLRAALRMAESWDLIRRDPSRGVIAPRRPPSAGVALSLPDARRLLAACDQDPHRALWRVLLLTGARIGEVLALRWSAVDLSDGAVTYRATVTEARDGRAIVRVGTKGGAVRTVPLDPETVCALQAHRTEQASRLRRIGDGWVFDRGDGERLPGQTVRLLFARILAREGLPSVRLHDCRHLVRTQLARMGVDTKTAGALLGHRPGSLVTDEVYLSTDAATQRAAVEALARRLGGG